MAGKSTKKIKTTAKTVSKHSFKPLKTKSSAPSRRQTGKSALRPVEIKVVGETVGQKKSPQKKTVPEKAVLREVAYLQAVPPPKKILSARSVKLQTILLERRVKLMKDIQGQLGQALTEEQQRQFESAMDTGDQALLDLERELDISLQEKWNRERQMIDESLVSLKEGTYGICTECDVHINEKRLTVMPFTRLCIACQEKIELFEKIERGEQRS